jgi:rubrerythrin
MKKLEEIIASLPETESPYSIIDIHPSETPQITIQNLEFLIACHPGERIRMITHIDSHRVEKSLPEFTEITTGQTRAHLKASLSLIKSELQKGSTLSLTGVQDLLPEFRKISFELERIFGYHVGANLYITPGNAPEGFGIHYDSHDVFAIQLFGEKIWKIFPNGKENNPVIQNLKANQAIFLKEGTYHTAQTKDKYSIHITFGIQRLKVEHYLKWLIEQIDPKIRKSPITKASKPNLKNVLLDKIENASVTEFLAERKSELIHHPLNLYQIFNTSITTESQITLTSPIELSDIKKESNTIVLYSNNQKLELDIQALPLITEIISKEKYKVKDLLSIIKISESELLDFLQELSENGIIYIYPEDIS